MISSSAITAQCLSHPNPAQAEATIWENTRYLIAQRVAHPDHRLTDEQHYNGYVVIPGPKCNPELVAPLANTDLNHLKNVHAIRFTDNVTTAGADQDIAMANFGVMTTAEADDFEGQLKAQRAKSG